MSNGFLKNTFIYGIGNVSVLIINFILVPFYTFYLSKTELGTYDFIVTTAALLAPFVTLQVEMAIVRWLLNEKSNQLKETVISSSLVLLLISLTIFSIFFYIFYLIKPFDNIILIYLFLVLYFVYPFLKQIIRAIGRSKQYAFIEVFYTLLFLLLAIFFIVVLKLNLKGLIIANIIALAAVVLFIVLFNNLISYIVNLNFNFTLAKQMLKYSIPMILNITSVWLMTSTIKYFIVFFLGYDSNGIYAVAYKFASIIQIVNTIFYLAWQEEAIKVYNSEKAIVRFEYILKNYISLLMFIMMLIIGLQQIIISYFIDPNFISVTKYIPIISFGFILMCLGSFYGIIYQCEKKTFGLSISALISGIFIIVFSFLMRTNYNLNIASFSFLFGFFIFFIYRVVDVKKYIKIKFPLSISLLYLFLTLILIYSSLNFSSFVTIFLLFIFLLILLLLNWKSLSEIMRSLKLIYYDSRT